MPKALFMSSKLVLLVKTSAPKTKLTTLGSSSSRLKTIKVRDYNFREELVRLLPSGSWVLSSDGLECIKPG